MTVKVLLLVAVVTLIPELGLSQMRLQRDPTYFIVAPKRIYPNEVVQVSVSITKLYSSTITVRASVRKQGMEYAAFKESFNRVSTRLLQMRMPPNARPGNYTLRVEGSITAGNSAGFVFENETDLIFDVKQASVFIQISKPLYKQGQEVKFRIVPVKPNLMAMHGSMNVYAVDPTNTVVRRWLAMQTNAGIVNMKMQLSDQPAYGKWTIRVVGFGDTYEKNFYVEEFFKPRMYVNVTMPLYVMEDSFAIAGLITANHTSGRPARGNGKLRLEIRDALAKIDPKKKYNWPSIERDISYFEGRTDFFFTLSELTDLLGRSPTTKEIHVNATIFDWYLLQNHTGYAISVVYSRDVILKLLGDRARTFKPGFPQTAYYAVMHQDGTPLVGIRRQVTIERTEKPVLGSVKSYPVDKLIVRDDGIVQYDFIPSTNAELVTLKAYYDNQQRSQSIESTFYRCYSPSGSYLHISTSTERPMVNEYMIFTIRTSKWTDTVHYQIISKGNIVVGNVLQLSGTQKTFSVALSREMVPDARMLAWYITQGEVVADSLNFFVNGTRMNEVQVKFNMGKDFSRDTIEVTGRTDPGSFIAFAGLDYDLWSHGGNTFITENEIIKELETYDSHANNSFQHMWRRLDEQYEQVRFSAPSYGVDANTTFAFAGMIVFTDANVTRVPHFCNNTQGLLPCFDGTCYRVDQRCSAGRQCVDGADEMGCNFDDPKFQVDPYTPPFLRMKHLLRHFEESGDFLWNGNFVKPDGQIDLRVKVPKEPMSWVVSAFSVSRDKGLGVVPTPGRYQSTRPFYIRVEMPTHIVKGEQMGVRIAIFNYWDVDLECVVTLHSSKDYRFIIVEDFGIVSSYSPRTAKGDIQTMVYVEASRMKTIHMPVLPIVEGDIKVTVSATSFMGRDTVTRPVNIKFDGITNFYNTPYLVDLLNQGATIIPDLEIPVDQRFLYPEQREHLYVPGSPQATVALVGDVVGPGFFTSHLDAENMLRRPYGCAEQNMFNFASNLYYLKYLKVTNQLRKDILLNALDAMNLDFQRQMSYFNAKEGYFSMFRDYQKATPSLWLTSFCLKVLQASDEADWLDYIYIPTDLLNKIALWIVTQQNKTNGAFWDPAPVYDIKMMSNLTRVGKEDLQLNISLTAHVLIALSEASGLTGQAQTAAQGAITLARAYIEKHVERLKDPFQTALITYALYVSNSPRRGRAFQILDGMKRTGEFAYWADNPIPANPVKVVNTVPFMAPRFIYKNEASAVQATGYALLVYLRNNMRVQSLPIMKWLQTMRNTFSGWGGTQDTVIALQALSEYSKQDTNRHLYNMEVTLESTSTQGWKKYLHLNRNNWQTLQTQKVPNVWGSVKASAKGTGMALLQLQTKVNVEYKHMIKPRPDGYFFNLTVERMFFHGKNFSIMEMTTCARWVRTDLTPKTGMAVIEVDLPTGYIAMNDDLRLYAQSGVVPTLRRAEFKGRRIHFYLDYIEATRKTCVAFRADRWYPISNGTIQHQMRVYDYYSPAWHNTTLYTTYNLYSLHICQVCGSFQCPYCPYYNMAATVQVSIIVSIIAMVTAHLTSKWLLSST